MYLMVPNNNYMQIVRPNNNAMNNQTLDEYIMPIV